MVTNKKLTIQSSADSMASARLLVLPNPGDVMIAMVFAWAFFCFFLVIGGKRILRQIARMAKSQEVRELILAGDQQLLTALMVGGCITIIVALLLVYRYPRAFIAVFAFGLIFGNASWKPLHDVALISKYLAVLCIGGIGVLFLYKNVWKVLATPYLRLWLLYIVFTAVVCIFLGGKNQDIWYLGSEFALVVGFSLAWLGAFVKDRDQLYEFNKVLAWTALAVCIVMLLAPILSRQAIQNSRFQGYTVRATMFAIVFTPTVLTLFWMSMIEKRAALRQLFTVFALIGFVLILWSGTRSAIAGTLLGVGILWWVFRARILYILFALACLGLIGQIFLGGSSDIAAITDRLQSAETGRTELWAKYFPIGLQSPLYGYSPSGVSRAVVGGSVQDFVDAVGGRTNYSGFHNSYLAMFLNFGGFGVGLMLLLLGISMRRAWQVIFSRRIPLEEKKIYVLQVAMMVVISIEALVEDIISASGKGTFIGLMYFSSVIICETHGRRLQEEYEIVQVKKIDGLNTERDPLAEEKSVAT